MILSRIKLYIKKAFRSKKTTSLIEFVKRTLTILELIVKDIGFLIIKINIRTTVEIKIDILFFVYINCSFNSKYIAQHTASLSL